MKPICRDLQERLAGEGAQALRADAAAQRHLEECAECFRALEGLARLDEALAAMPALDAPERVVDELLARVGSEATEATSEPPKRVLPSIPRPVLWGVATAAAVLVAVSVLTPSFMRARAPGRYRSTAEFGTADRIQATPPPTLAREGEEQRDTTTKNGQFNKEEADKLRGLGYLGDKTGADDAARKLEENKRQGDVVVSSGEPDFRQYLDCLLYTSPSPRDRQKSRMPSSA